MFQKILVPIGLSEKDRIAVEAVADLGRADSSTVTLLHRQARAEIVRFAGEQPCDPIVLGSHRLDPERPGGGSGPSVTRWTLLAGCPVLLMR